ncbi:hypothetical protein JYT74_02930 [Crocinitomix catalasitica]|nr:hypothetical protein [Crocinitomix catalasitica]
MKNPGLVFLLIIACSANSSAQKCHTVSNFKAIKEYILTKGFLQNSNVPPYPVAYHYSDDIHGIEFEHYTMYKPDKKVDYEKLHIKTTDNMHFAYDVVLRGKKLKIEYHQDNTTLEEKYEAHFCELVTKMKAGAHIK